MGKKKIRSAVIESTFINCVHSPLIHFLILLGVGVISFLFYNTLLVFIFPFAYVAIRFKLLLYEFFLLQHVVENSLGIWPWYTRIDDHIILGSLPLQSLRHVSQLTMDENVGAVLSVVEPWEVDDRALLVGKPVTPEQWKVQLSY